MHFALNLVQLSVIIFTRERISNALALFKGNYPYNKQHKDNLGTCKLRLSNMLTLTSLSHEAHHIIVKYHVLAVENLTVLI